MLDEIKMKTLLLSLGHGSSAVLIKDNRIVCGYENERLSGIKSDSHYPAHAIEEIDMRWNLFDVDTVMISHWFIDGRLPSIPNKYYNPIHLERTCPSAKIICTNMEFTHHDAHMYSAKLFAGPTYTNKNTLGVVCDGFGTMGETLSLYSCADNKLRLTHRSFGFSSSLGLLYQYATSYLGMKENQDEYKLLGYEPTIYNHFTSEEINLIDEWCDEGTRSHLKDIMTYSINKKFDPLCSIDALPALKLVYRDRFDQLLGAFNLKLLDAPKDKVRALIAYYVQKRVEDTLITIILGAMGDCTKLLLTGGVFMNVKLNNRLLNICDEICIMPLCGDQGAPLGLYEASYPDELTWPNHLFWGERDLTYKKLPLNIFYSNSLDSAIDLIVSQLKNNNIVNLVRGNMEFGSRALCNTSTLALPTIENVEYINTANARSTIMPMAPVMSRETARTIFKSEELNKVHKSLEYMVCTLTYGNKYIGDYLGAAHKIPGTELYSGRPQITDDSFMLSILKDIPGGVLINTSFNIHGKPIVYDIEDIVECHEFQKNHDPLNRIVTLVIGE